VGGRRGNHEEGGAIIVNNSKELEKRQRRTLREMPSDLQPSDQVPERRAPLASLPPIPRELGDFEYEYFYSLIRHGFNTVQALEAMRPELVSMPNVFMATLRDLTENPDIIKAIDAYHEWIQRNRNYMRASAFSVVQSMASNPEEFPEIRLKAASQLVSMADKDEDRDREHGKPGGGISVSEEGLAFFNRIMKQAEKQNIIDVEQGGWEPDPAPATVNLVPNEDPLPSDAGPLDEDPWS
jgi:hypothetical protein